MPRSSAPKLTQGAVMAILVAATVAALTWLAQAPAPERGASVPQPPEPPAALPPISTPDPRPAPGGPAVQAPPPRAGPRPARLPRRPRPEPVGPPSRPTRASPAPGRRDPRRRRERRPGACSTRTRTP